MGYCYEGNRLVCDACSVADGTVRKVRCKYGYCQPPAMCRGCRGDREKMATFRAYCDTNCREASAEFAAREARKEAMLDAGEYIRTSARSTESGLVAVLFSNRAGEDKVYLMDTDTYRAVPILEVATIADFEKIGRVVFRAVVAA
jgi:hypothetical protein